MRPLESKLFRFSDNGESTLGLIFIEKRFCCFDLEDEFRTTKVMGETRIPAGRYQIKLRTEGRFHERFKKRFPAHHVGMLELQDVPNYKYILIHPGNTDDDTGGCILPGDICENNRVTRGKLQSSTRAYIRLYSEISQAIVDGRDAFITVYDEDSFMSGFDIRRF